jgi:Protein of unknown function (DUF2946)
MHLRSRHRWVTAWFLVWAMVLSTLMPLTAQAVVAPRLGSTPFELCTSTGMVVLQTADASTSEPGLTLSVVCSWCLLQCGSAALPSPHHSVPLLQVAHARPLALYTSAYLQPQWRAAQSRAPPLA